MGLKYVGEVKVLYVYTMDHRTMETLANDDGNPMPFFDGGVGPDGPSWYVPVEEIAEEVVRQIVAYNLGCVTDAHVIAGYTGSMGQKHELTARHWGHWCGFRSRGVAYARDAE